MSPESSEGRERITRLESRLEDVKSDVERNERTFGPLPLAVERLQWTIDAINARLDKRDAADDERFERLARSFENQITACSHQVAAVAEAHERWRKSEDQRRKDERREEQEREREAQTTATQKAIAKYGPTATLVAALLAFLGVIFQSLFGGG